MYGASVGHGASVGSSFAPSVASTNNTVEFRVPLNADVRISYFSDSGVFISSSRVITQQILDDAVAALLSTLRNEFTSLVNISSQQETLAMKSEASTRAIVDLNLTTTLAAESMLRADADVKLATDITSESTARVNADLFLAANIVSESSIRLDADMINYNSLLLESSRAQSKEASLSAMDSTFVSLSNLSVLDTFVNGRIVVAAICQTAPLSPLQYGSHSNCAGSVNGFTCTPICFGGFFPNSSFTCVAGVWSGAVSCLPQPCNVLPNPIAYGNVTLCINKPNGTICDPVCIAGYSNQSAFLCVLGNWSGSPACAPLPCPTLAIPSNGFLNDTATPITNGVTSSIVLFSCSAGYSLLGLPSATCLPTSFWTTSPTCAPLPCPTLTVPINGLLNGTATSITNGVTKSVARFSCASAGYSIVGATSTTCQMVQPDMTWLPASHML